jgi:hypothetical protein
MCKNRVKSAQMLMSRNKKEGILCWYHLSKQRDVYVTIPCMYPPLEVGGDSGASWCQYLAPFSKLVPFIIRKAKYHLPSVLVLALPTTPSILFSLSQKSHHSYPYRPPSLILETECGNVLPSVGSAPLCIMTKSAAPFCQKSQISHLKASKETILLILIYF